MLDDRLRFLDRSPDLLGIIDSEGGFTYVNPTWERLFGCAPEKLTALLDLNVVHPDDREATEAAAQKLSQGMDIVDFENRCQTRQKTYCWISWTVSTFADDSQMYVVGRDVTRRKQADIAREQSLQREKAALAIADSANQTKNDFLAVVSHELRTPLNPILGWTQLLRRGDLSAEKTRTALATIDSSARLQGRLINCLLDVAYLSRGRIKLAWGLVDLNDSISAAVEASRSTAEAKRIDVQQFVLAGNSVVVQGDAERLQQVISNLLSNAIKFTPLAGQVVVTLSIEDSSACVQVTDTGIGIDTKFIPYVFDCFWQADSSTTRRFEGLGIGLTIARQLVAVHDGFISVKSPGKGQGATFSMNIPLAQLSKDYLA